MFELIDVGRAGSDAGCSLFVEGFFSLPPSAWICWYDLHVEITVEWTVAYVTGF